MDLLLWRHAEAEEDGVDMERVLTARGEKQAKQMARWLTARLKDEGKKEGAKKEGEQKGTRIVVSSAVRTQQTADALGLPYEVRHSIRPGAGVDELVAAAGWPSAEGRVLLVGHQASLGRLASFLLTGEEADWSIRKGGIWWLRHRVRNGKSQTVLRAVISPEMLF